MDMGIVNPGSLGIYDEIDASLRERIEDLLLDRREATLQRGSSRRQSGSRGRRAAGSARKGEPPGGFRGPRSGSSMRSSTASRIGPPSTPRRRGSLSRPPTPRSAPSR